MIFFWSLSILFKEVKEKELSNKGKLLIKICIDCFF